VSALSTAPFCSVSRLNGLLRDLRAGLGQQMFFWGKDVVHPSGNLFAGQGFTKSPSRGLQGTSCYGVEWQDGSIQLHGSCAGWYPRGGGEGFIYIRPLHGCFVWRGEEIPVPGEWESAQSAGADPMKIRELALPFLDWWLHSETWIRETCGSSYRAACFRHFKRLPKSRPWLPPADGLRWLRAFRESPEKVERVNRFVR
jgi:hypothetical protein